MALLRLLGWVARLSLGRERQALKEIARFLMGSHHVGGGSELRSMNDEI